MNRVTVGTAVVRRFAGHAETWQPRFRSLIVPGLTATWLFIVCAGLFGLWRYSATPGELESPPTAWPEQSSIERNLDCSNLLVFVHPHCPCSRATLRELNQLVRSCQKKVAARVVFLRPTKFERGWERTDLWQSAVEMPGVTAICDAGGTESEMFCAKTSGLTLLYDKNGALSFQGGITSSRGHEGDNAGRSAITALVLNQTSCVNRTSVFGCCLHGASKDKGGN